MWHSCFYPFSTLVEATCISYGIHQTGQHLPLLLIEIGKLQAGQTCTDPAEGELFREGGDIINDSTTNSGHTKINIGMFHNINLSTLRSLTGVGKIDKLKSIDTDVFHSQTIFRTVTANKKAAFRYRIPMSFSSIYFRSCHNHPGF